MYTMVAAYFQRGFGMLHALFVIAVMNGVYLAHKKVAVCNKVRVLHGVFVAHQCVALAEGALVLFNTEQRIRVANPHARKHRVSYQFLLTGHALVKYAHGANIPATHLIQVTYYYVRIDSGETC